MASNCSSEHMNLFLSFSKVSAVVFHGPFARIFWTKALNHTFTHLWFQASWIQIRRTKFLYEWNKHVSIFCGGIIDDASVSKGISQWESKNNFNIAILLMEKTAYLFIQGFSRHPTLVIVKFNFSAKLLCETGHLNKLFVRDYVFPKLVRNF